MMALIEGPIRALSGHTLDQGTPEQLGEGNLQTLGQAKTGQGTACWSSPPLMLTDSSQAA